MRTVRKQIKRNREPDPVRRKDWMPGDPDNLEEYDVEAAPVERVMPRGEQERRRRVLAQAMAALAEADDNGAGSDSPAIAAEGRRGVVVEVSSGQCRVEVEGEALLCRLRGSLTAQDTGHTNVVAVGDEVLVSDDGHDGGVVEAVLPRRSALARPDVFHSHLRQVIAANVDQLLVVASWREPAVWLELIDRYLIAAQRHNLAPVICLNKVDLAEDAAECRATMQPYADAGYRVIHASAVTGDGVDELREALRGKTTVLAGLSGVGKSSLLNAVEPGLRLATGDVSDHDHLGRHTTTQVSMRRLGIGGSIVDTPGIRQFGLAGLRKRDLQTYYPEMAPLAAECRFADCLHQEEPDCAVRAAVETGSLARGRYVTYLKVLATLPA